ncbi:SseB family protein [Arthrobacter agilis]|uniref:SseB family protein n=1 Tax=Arthrobacter agilis TaxID=37921 RepID=UPI00236624D8|nr:SseB family protein [Arthrobacter agilis]WDF34311.1 SseB family protein [Arthrobacter agilis]
MSVAVPRLMEPDGADSGEQWFDAAAHTPVTTFLEQCGLPLHFVDGTGLWAVTLGESARVEAVVRQAPAPDGRGSVPEVLYAVDRALDHFTADDGAVHVVFRSAPGPLAEVVESAKTGRSWTRPRTEGEVGNDRVARAVAQFAERPDQRTMIEVLRACLTGELLLDVTGSDAASPVLRGFVGANGLTALGVFTAQADLARFVAGQPDAAGEPQSLAMPGASALQTALKDTGADWVYVNPAGPTCALARPDLEFALQGPPNRALREAVLRQGSQQELFTAMLGDSRVFLGEVERDGRKQPITVSGDGVGSTVTQLAVFTSAAEVAAHDPAAAVRAFTPGRVAQLVFDQRLGGMLIDPAGPSASIGSFQIWHLLGTPSLERG